MRKYVAAILAGSLASQPLGTMGNGHEARGSSCFSIARCPVPHAALNWGSQALANPAIQEQTRIGDPHLEATLRSQESSLREPAGPASKLDQFAQGFPFNIFIIPKKILEVVTGDSGVQAAYLSRNIPDEAIRSARLAARNGFKEKLPEISRLLDDELEKLLDRFFTKGHILLSPRAAHDKQGRFLLHEGVHRAIESNPDKEQILKKAFEYLKSASGTSMSIAILFDYSFHGRTVDAAEFWAQWVQRSELYAEAEQWMANTTWSELKSETARRAKDVLIVAEALQVLQKEIVPEVQKEVGIVMPMLLQHFSRASYTLSPTITAGENELASPVQEERPERHSPADRSS